MHEQNKFNKEIEIIKKKNRNPEAEELKNSIESFSSRFDYAEERISELEDK